MHTRCHALYLTGKPFMVSPVTSQHMLACAAARSAAAHLSHGCSFYPTENTFGGDPKKENFVLITRRTRSARYVFFAPSPPSKKTQYPFNRVNMTLKH